jgi:hypothetical protein
MNEHRLWPPVGRRPTSRAVAVFLLLTPHSSLLTAQAWNSPEALALVGRAVERRVAAQADSGLHAYHTRAHGFVFFLAQVGEGLTAPPRLIKADELDVEVYWQAPNRSKQVIRGWRDGRFLPTDINYHRDHLGIVTNNFGNFIRIGEGDEVRDVAHPLSTLGLDLYDFALGDSLTVRTPRGTVTVRQVQVRPRVFARPLVVGTLYLDLATAELVRFRFSFTPAAYLDRQLEDISIVLENALYRNRYWLPLRQEVEIRRRISWLDFPARGIIRGRWEIGDYDLDPALPPALFAGVPIAGLQHPMPSDTSWGEPLERAIAQVAAPVNRQDMAALRVEVERIAGARALAGLPSKRLAAGGVSDLIHVNRVQGLTLGFGGVMSLARSKVQVRPSLTYGTSDDRLTGSLTASLRLGATRFGLTAARRIRDFSDLPVIAPVVNSLTSQEGGKDFGDYVLLHTAGLNVRQRLSGRTSLDLDLSVEESQSVSVTASPANGSYRPNPPLGAGTYRTIRVGLERASGGIAVHRDLQGRVALEAGAGPRGYVRGSVEGRWLATLGTGTLLTRAYFGIGSDGLPAYRSFVLGGRGTLVGEPFRAFGGRSAALTHLEWRLDVPAPAIPLGPFVSTGSRLTVAPFVELGVAGRPLSGLPWSSSDGVRPVAGLALELFMRLLRIEAGVGLRDGHAGLTIDINRDWWGLL